MSGRHETLTQPDRVLRVEDVRRNGSRARPNVYKRSLEARENTNAYLAEMERKPLEWMNRLEWMSRCRCPSSGASGRWPYLFL